MDGIYGYPRIKECIAFYLRHRDSRRFHFILAYLRKKNVHRVAIYIIQFPIRISFTLQPFLSLHEYVMLFVALRPYYQCELDSHYAQIPDHNTAVLSSVRARWSVCSDT